MKFPVGSKHKALCEDGAVRTATVTRSPDTFFSVPARVKAKGKTVTGFLTCEDEKVEFFADRWRKNADVFGWKKKKVDPNQKEKEEAWKRYEQACLNYMVHKNPK